MYTVFLVEDEPLIRENMRAAIENGSEPFSCVGEAGDGELALTTIQDLKPDILVTDIKMPFMDGLTLARHARAILPSIHIIIVSGHDDFDLAREAIDIGVDQYVLKPMASSDLFAALRVAGERIAEREKRNESFLKEHSNDETVRTALVGSFLEELCNGGIGADESLSRANELSVGLLSARYAVAIALCERADGYPNRQAIFPKVKRALESDPDVLYFMSGPDRVALIVKGQADADTADKAYRVAETLKREIGDDRSTTVTVSVSEVTRRISGIRDAYREADLLLKTFAGARRGRVFRPGDLDRADGAGDPEPYDLIDANAENKLRFATDEDIPAIVGEFTKALYGDETQGLLYRYYVLMDLTAAAMRIIHGINPSLARAELSRHFADRKEIFRSAVSSRDFAELATGICRKFVELRDGGNGCHRKKLVSKACEYIDENYNDPDISLNAVAAHVRLGPTRFSAIFAEEMSVTFIEHLTAIRIRKVKELLLSSDDKIVDIAFAVGYNEPNYLSYLFKKREGLSPKEYRQRKKSLAGKA